MRKALFLSLACAIGGGGAVFDNWLPSEAENDGSGLLGVWKGLHTRAGKKKDRIEVLARGGVGGRGPTDLGAGDALNDTLRAAHACVLLKSNRKMQAATAGGSPPAPAVVVGDRVQVGRRRRHTPHNTRLRDIYTCCCCLLFSTCSNLPLPCFSVPPYRFFPLSGAGRVRAQRLGVGPSGVSGWWAVVCAQGGERRVGRRGVRVVCVAPGPGQPRETLRPCSRRRKRQRQREGQRQESEAAAGERRGSARPAIERPRYRWVPAARSSHVRQLAARAHRRCRLPRTHGKKIKEVLSIS